MTAPPPDAAPVKQAIAGVSPPELGEVTVMTVWPTMAALPFMQSLGRKYANRSGMGHFLTLGKLWMLLTIPIVLPIYFMTLLPGSARRYRLTNRRVLIERGTRGEVVKGVALDEFDAIDVDVRPGQAWYPAGDLVFRRGALEVLRLEGVSRPETFRQTCLKAHRGYVGVKGATRG